MTRRAGVLFAVLVAIAAFAAPVLALDRIGVRVVGGEGEFYSIVTGMRFTPRGVNYVDFQPTSFGYEDRSLATNVFDAARISAALRVLAAEGYNTVRVFFDLCNTGPHCIVREGVSGLNPDYLDNIASFTRLAAEHDIHVLFTSNDIPDHGGYGALANRDAGPIVAGYRNAHFMTAGGVAAFESYWRALMHGLAARDTAWEAVLGWSLLNEQWIFADQPPWSLAAGSFVNGTGRSYDLADRAQKRAALADNLVLIAGRVRDIVRSVDRQALVTMGFFAPQFPNPTTIGGDWYVDTEPLLAAAPLDFFDFHAYVDTDLDIVGQAENFGLPRHRDRPVIMGEVGASPAFIPRVETALRAEQEWMAESCDEGFDGWLHWGYYPFPPQVDLHPPYTLLSHDRLLLRGLSPKARPDPCRKGGYEPHVNLAFDATARASRSLPGHPPGLALDGRETTWESGIDAPGWIAIELGAPARLATVTLWLAQWPAGETRHRVTADLGDGTAVLVGDIVRRTADGDRLTFNLPGGLADVIAVRVEIVSSPSWVSLRDVQLLRGGDGTACLLRVSGAVNLRGDASTERPAVGRIAAGSAVIAEARIAGADGHDWFRTTAGTFARADVVTANPACANL